jgi:hypothetical protein
VPRRGQLPRCFVEGNQLRIGRNLARHVISPYGRSFSRRICRGRRTR